MAMTEVEESREKTPEEDMFMKSNSATLLLILVAAFVSRSSTVHLMQQDALLHYFTMGELNRVRERCRCLI
jgi:hypothetical protein